MELSDQIVKLLDRDETIVLFKNQLGTYTAAVIRESLADISEEISEMPDLVLTHTDDFTPGKALHRLSEKMFRTGEYANWPVPKE